MNTFIWVSATISLVGCLICLLSPILIELWYLHLDRKHLHQLERKQHQGAPPW